MDILINSLNSSNADFSTDTALINLMHKKWSGYKQ